jgi:hypothetical protein
MQIFTYDTATYPFPQIIADFLGEEDLGALACELSADEADQNSLYKNMESSAAYKQLYAQLNGEAGQKFYQTYERFVREVIRPQYAEPIFYQKKPTHRILFSNTPGQSRFHRDRDYGHSTAEINYLVPQSPAFGTNTMWLESEEGKEDFKPVEMLVGEFVRFNGASLMHGAKVNTTGRSRVSFDFRVIPQSKAPAQFADSSRWKEEDLDNPLLQNAHNFALCP